MIGTRAASVVSMVVLTVRERCAFLVDGSILLLFEGDLRRELLVLVGIWDKWGEEGRVRGFWEG